MVTRSPPSSRFEQSFVFHMIRDFFLLLVAVAAVELAIRYAALRWDFATAEAQRVDRAAQQLANDVRSIMLNAGGPIAARTVYPILNRNYDDLGLSIAVLPSEVTVASMKESRGLNVQGLRTDWPAGPHQAASVSLTAEQFCLGCHVKAKVGDVLGTVSVRSYLDRKEAVWWQEVRVTAGALSLKILAHTIVLFLLLKVRMAPLLALRGTVSGLARGVMDLSPRAAVKTEDEFGELAQDLNHFLDRIALVVRDLDGILSEVVAVGERLGALNQHLEQQLDGLREATPAGGQGGVTPWQAASAGGGLVARVHGLQQTLEALAGVGQLPAPAAAVLREQAQGLASSAQALTGLLSTVADAPASDASAVGYRAVGQSLRDMAALEATMQAVAQSGQRLLQRLTQGRRGVAVAGPALPATRPAAD